MESLDNAFMEDSFGGRDSYGVSRDTDHRLSASAPGTPDFCLWAAQNESSKLVQDASRESPCLALGAPVKSSKYHVRLSVERKSKEKVIKKRPTKKGRKAASSVYVTRRRTEKTTTDDSSNSLTGGRMDAVKEENAEQMLTNGPAFNTIDYEADKHGSTIDSSRSHLSSFDTHEPIIFNIDTVNDSVTLTVPITEGLLAKVARNNFHTKNKKEDCGGNGEQVACSTVRMNSDRVISEQDSFPSPADMTIYRSVRRRMTRQLRRSSISMWSSDWVAGEGGESTAGQSVDEHCSHDNVEANPKTSVSIGNGLNIIKLI